MHVACIPGSVQLTVSAMQLFMVRLIRTLVRLVVWLVTTDRVVAAGAHQSTSQWLSSRLNVILGLGPPCLRFVLQVTCAPLVQHFILPFTTSTSVPCVQA